MRVSGPVMAHNYGRITQNAFGGLNRNIGAADGEIAEMVNMTGDYYPLLATREQGWVRSTPPWPSHQNDDILAFKIIDGREVWAIKVDTNMDELQIRLPNGETESAYLLNYVGEEKEIIYVNGKICVFPEKVYYDTAIEKANTYSSIETILPKEEIDGNYVWIHSGDWRLYWRWQGEWVSVNSIRDMEAEYTGQYSIEDGTIAGIEAEKNTIKIEREDITGTFLPEIGDAVSISGSVFSGNIKTAIIKEIETDETYIYLRFAENTFASNETQTGEIRRMVPDLKHVCEHKNRLWGCVDNQIFASHLGNPLNWYEYESLADGAWAVEIGSGELTACFSYNYPLFFTENEIYTVLGDTPMEFSLSVTPNTYGCAKGSHKSFAVVREYLFYHSPYGFCYYYGSVPQLCSYNLGTDYYHDAIGGGKGHKYYVSCSDSSDNEHSFVFDARLNTWHEEKHEGNKKLIAYTWDGDLYAVYGDKLFTVGLPRTQYDEPEFEDDDMPSLVRFAPWDMDSVNKKQLKSVYIRHDVEGELTVKLFQDGIENVSLRKTVTGQGMAEIPNIPRRGDRWYLQLEGVGPWKVYSIAYDVYEGSARK